MKKLKLVIILSVVLCSLNLFAGGKDIGNGGDLTVLEFLSLRTDLFKLLKQSNVIYQSELSADEIISKADSIEVTSKDRLFLHEKEVDAINNSETKEIKISRSRWISSHLKYAEKLAFILHEYIGALGSKIDLNYDLSKRFLIEIKSILALQKKKMTDYVCSLKRLHCRGFAGYEYLGTISTIARGSNRTGYLYSRVRNTNKYIKDYWVAIERTWEASWWGVSNLHEPKLIVTLYYDRKHDHTIRKTIFRETINFDQPDSSVGRNVSIRLLGNEYFNDNGSSLEIDCYKTASVPLE